MRITPIVHAYFSLGIGLLFVFFAFEAVEETVLNPLTLFLTLLATFQLAASYRLFKLHVKVKQKQQEKNNKNDKDQ
ncbi:uncharacterized protein DUF4305 [Streptohalobacillus salinus]|uniref:Uncharacterized protein DUF4305 n=1 Tax=Streptohalobacillus salinus TaxID=621096 RepID=A0A2V3VXN0_9BACI|nr:DUF4305 domain-containing protein [Streptohalobacillus salinus]PXW86386.1 uncharacterized protein DUF4305 [Streptohalobacillus salinus]